MNEDLVKFEKIVDDLIASQSKEELLTSDDEKSLIIFSKLFEKGRSTIRLFARSLCDDAISNNPRFIISLSDFIERGGKLMLLLSQYDMEEAKKHPLFSRLAYYQHEGKNVVLKRTSVVIIDTDDPDKLPIKICVVDKNAYRLYPECVSRQAKCCFNDDSFSATLITLFDSIFDNREESFEVSLDTFFNPVENGPK